MQLYMGSRVEYLGTGILLRSRNQDESIFEEVYLRIFGTDPTVYQQL